MKVKAIEKCYYDHEIKMPGEVFELHDVKTKNDKGEKITISAEDQFSERSMVSLEDEDDDQPVKPRKRGANKGDRVVVSKSNPNTDDNRKSKEDLDNAHGGEEGKGEDDEEVPSKSSKPAKDADVL